ncbi:AAA family ATPase [Vibrio alginolyticus]
MFSDGNHDDLYIVQVIAKQHPFIKQSNVHIKSSDGSRKNIIITGRNGYGKSTFLKALKGFIATAWSQRNSLDRLQQQLTKHTQNYKILQRQFESIANPTPQEILLFNQECTQYAQNGLLIQLEFNSVPALTMGQHVLGYFEAKRMTELQKPNSITAPQLNQDAIGSNNAGSKFLAHLVNRRSQLAFANEEGEEEEAIKIREWFNNLDNLFSLVFEKKVKLKFIRAELDFVIEAEDGELIDIKKLSDGYSAIINIVTEIITRMEAISFGRLDIGGIVLIDEVETHLHVALQKKILPFLNTMFPNIQFIVTTHSPFVLASAKNAIIYDIASGTQLDSEDEIWKYGYEDIVEGYFDTDSHSDELEDKIDEYEFLVNKSEHTVDENRRLILLKNELEDSPTFKMPHIELRLRKLGIKE